MELNPEWGWRAAFRYPMIPMLLMLVAFFFFFKNCPEDAGFEPIVDDDGARDEALSEKIRQKGYFYPYIIVTILLQLYYKFLKIAIYFLIFVQV